MIDDTRQLGGSGDRLPVYDLSRGMALSPVGPASSQQEYEDDGFDLSTIWQVLWGRRFWILGAGALGLAISLAASLLQTPLYRATATLELNPPVVPILGRGGGQGGEDMSVPTTDYQFLETQYGLLRSRNLARRVVEDLDLADKPSPGAEPQDAEARIEAKASALAGSITVKPLPDSRLVELTYTSPKPQEAATVVNGYAEAFVTSTLDRRYEATANARKFLTTRLAAARTELDESERRLVAYARAKNIIITQASGSKEGGGGGASSLAGASLVSLNDALSQAQQKRIAAEQRFRQSGAITETNQSTAALRQEKAKLEAEYREKSTLYQADFPDMVRLRSRIGSLDQAIRGEAGQASGSLRAEYQAALAEEGSLRARVRQLSGNVQDERERSVQYNILQRELDTNRSLYDTLLERYNQVGVASGIGTAQATIVDRSQVPGAPFSPNIPRSIVLGLLLGLGLGALVAFVYEKITDTIKTPDDVREKLRLPALGVIPMKKRKESLSELLADPKAPISEAYASLITTLQFTTSKGLPQVLLVTSSRASEGKSTTSFVLAKRLAEAGKRVLLVDADMRKPSFVVEEQADLGLSRLLTGDGVVDKHILPTRDHGLCLMPSGPVPPNPSQLLGSPVAAQIIDRLRKHFDFIVLDAPPTHGFADAPLLSALADGILFVVESGKTRRSMALEALVRLRSANPMILGAALTKHQAIAGNYGYSSNYYEQYNSLKNRSRKHELMPLLLDANSRA